MTADTTPSTAPGLSSAAINQLVEDTLPLVSQLVSAVAANYPRHADREELAQAASLGLVEAAHRYDPSRGVPFGPWAAMRIRGAIIDAARALDFAPRSVRAAGREIEAAHAELQNVLGRTPEHDELAAHLNISSRELVKTQGKLHRSLVLSLEAPTGDEDGSPVTLADNVVAPIASAAAQLENREQAAYLIDALELLPERLQTVIRGYFLEGRTSADLAEQLDVTESRVSQLRSEGLALLRAGLEAQYAEIPAAPVETATTPAARRKAAYAASLTSRSTCARRLRRSVPDVELIAA